MTLQDRTDAVRALGDQIQAACDASDLRVAGFAVILADIDGIGVEARSQVSAQTFDAMMRAYLDAR